MMNFTLSFYFKITDYADKSIVYSKSGKWKIELINKVIKVIADEITILSDAVADLNKWYNLAFVIDSGGANIHINGVETKYAFAYDLLTKDIVFGTSKSNKLFFKGYIGKVKIFSRTLENKELCHLSGLCKVVIPDESDTCDFIPKGLNLSDCVNDCKRTQNCDLDYCQSVCKNCVNYEKCQWIKKPLPPKEEAKKKGIHTEPYQPEIRCHPWMARLLLNELRPYDGGSPITQYLVMVYEKFAVQKKGKIKRHSRSRMRRMFTLLLV